MKADVSLILSGVAEYSGGDDDIHWLTEGSMDVPASTPDSKGSMVLALLLPPKLCHYCCHRGPTVPMPPKPFEILPDSGTSPPKKPSVHFGLQMCLQNPWTRKKE